jgi:lysophospholipase L1-like esterase
LRRLSLVSFIALFVITPASARATEPFELLDGDRVVFVGSTFIEREQRYGYWEHILTRWWPERNVTFRNLGWSGDTVWGEARAGFDTPREGYRRLIEQTLAIKPTVLFIGYGINESFAGKAGLARFQEQLNRLLDDLQPSQARMVLLAPPMFEKETWPGGDFAGRKADLELYTQALRQVAEKRRIRFVPEFCQAGGPASPLTDNGMHLTAHGYCFTSGLFACLLGMKDDKGSVLVELDGLKPKRLTRKVLFGPLEPPDSSKDRQYDSFVIAQDLNPGKYTLKIDGRPVHTANADTWMREPEWGRVLVRDGPSIAQSEKLRQAIVEKNRLFFNRFRPQNDTYLFGFRKQEQGQNAKEIAEFDPLVAKLEKEIARLRKPVPHTYQLVPAEEEKKK